MGIINEEEERKLATQEKEKARTLVYTVFTECISATRGTSQPFISGHFHTQEVPFDNLAELKAIKEIFDFFSYEYFTPIYDASNLSAALKPAKPGVDITSVRQKTFLQTLLKTHGFADKEDFPAEHTECMFDGQPVSHTVLNHMVARKTFGNSVVILNLGGFARHGDSISITDTLNGRSIDIDIASDIKSLYNWLTKNRNPKRKYTFNPKHGDINKRAWKGYAQLKTSEEDTTRLLSQSVGDSRNSAVWFYDEEREEFIYFENQNEFPPNFHGYHVKEGEENYDNINFEKLRTVQDIP